MVIESLVFGLLAALGWGASDFVAALITRRIGGLPTVFWVHVGSVALSSAYLPFASGLGGVSPTQWAEMAGISVLAFGTYIFFYRALQLGPIAIVTPIIGANAVVVILLAVALAGERLSGLQFAAMAAVVGGVALTSVDLRNLRSSRELIGRGVLFGIVAMLCLGSWQYLVGLASRSLGWFLPIYLTRMMTLGMVAPALAVTRTAPWRALGPKLLAGALFVAALETLGLFAFARGSEVGVISIVAASATVYPVPADAGRAGAVPRANRAQPVGRPRGSHGRPDSAGGERPIMCAWTVGVNAALAIALGSCLVYSQSAHIQAEQLHDWLEFKLSTSRDRSGVAARHPSSGGAQLYNRR